MLYSTCLAEIGTMTYLDMKMYTNVARYWDVPGQIGMVGRYANTVVPL